MERWEVPFWERLGMKGGVPAHLPLEVNEVGRGPVPGVVAHHYECWCGDVECPLTLALQHAWSAGRRVGESRT